MIHIIEYEDRRRNQIYKFQVKIRKGGNQEMKFQNSRKICQPVSILHS